jgi:hypothetical protein
MQAVMLVLYVAAAIVQAAAFMEGIDLWWGIGSILAVIVFVVALALGIIGSIFATGVAFYGAWKGWGWPWYGAVAVAAPSLILTFALVGAETAFSAITQMFRR